MLRRLLVPVYIISMIASFLLMLAVTVYLSYCTFSAGLTKRFVDTRHIPDMFPILAISKLKDGSISPAIIIEAHLYKRIESLPNYTFLVPTGMEHDINKRLRCSKMSYGPGSIEAHELAQGLQYVKVVYSWNEGWNYQAGWYVASEKSYTPKYEADFRIGNQILTKAPVAFFVNVLIWIGIAIFCRWRRGRKWELPPLQ